MNKKLTKRILAAAGTNKASLVFKHANVVNVFTAGMELLDIAVEDGYIVGLGDYDGMTEIDLRGQIVVPSFIDGHIHLESSMVAPGEFERSVIPHGTQAVVTDPHEIANVAGVDGINFMMERTRGLTLDVHFMLPSCVPATGLDESGAVLPAEKLEPFYKNERVLGLAELMNSYGAMKADPAVLLKVRDAKKRNKLIDGHAPGLSGKALNAYITAGVQSDHECFDISEALEKLSRGQWIMIREGTAAKNLEALMPLFKEPYYHRCMLVTDDKHPGDLIRLGHIDYIIKKAVRLGADPIHAVIMGSFNAARYFGLKHIGAVAPGYRANFSIISDFEGFEVRQVYKNGKLVAEDGMMKEGILAAEIKNIDTPARVGDSFHLREIIPEQLHIEETGDYARVLCLTKGELTTTEKIVPWVEKEGTAPGVDTDQDIVKMAVFERHHDTGHVGLGFLGGYGLKRGAVATSIAHDSHNLIIAGTNDADMVLAGNQVRKNRGGLAVVADGEILGELALPIAGLMSEETADAVDRKLEELKKKAEEIGVNEGIDPFMTLAFASLPVIPKLRLNTYGLIDVDQQKIVRIMEEKASCIRKSTDLSKEKD